MLPCNCVHNVLAHNRGGSNCLEIEWLRLLFMAPSLFSCVTSDEVDNRVQLLGTHVKKITWYNEHISCSGSFSNPCEFAVSCSHILEICCPMLMLESKWSEALLSGLHLLSSYATHNLRQCSRISSTKVRTWHLCNFFFCAPHPSQTMLKRKHQIGQMHRMTQRCHENEGNPSYPSREEL